MPAKCVKCGGVFDMSYDYKNESDESLAGLPEKEAIAKKVSKLLCWECRANAKRQHNEHG